MSEAWPDEPGMAWLVLRLVPGLGDAGAHCLVRALGSATAAVSASASAWAKILGRDRGRCIQWLPGACQAAQQQWNTAVRRGASVLTRESDAYPALLASIASPPPVLFALGQLPQDGVSVAIVGPRRASPYGLEVARMLGRELAARNVTVVSGMAAGVDAAAHDGALEAGGPTVAVLGCGVDVAYPSCNRALHRRIQAHGAVVSQFPMGSRPEPGSFPRRNRTVSGLSMAVVIVEAPKRSGSLITAAYAAAQGRKTLVVPGSILDGRNEGGHNLLRGDAQIAGGVDDILAVLPQPEVAPPAAAAGRRQDVLTEVQQRVLAEMDPTPQAVDEIAAATAMPAAQLLSVLLELELSGRVRQWPGQRFARIPTAR